MILISLPGFSQISHGGNPVFKFGKAKTEVSTIELPVLEMMSAMNLESESGAVKLKYAQYAYKYNVSYNSSSDGIWENLDDGRRVWRLSLSSPGAYSLGLVFSKFKLPANGKLFVYNHQSDKILGAYTEENNKKSGQFAIEPLAGDHLIVEYIEPTDAAFEAVLEIGTILHDYKNIFNLLKGANKTKNSGSCNVNINCSEGDDWQLEKKSVCHILYGGWIASGALINNTNFDGTPYVLTAHHAINDSDEAGSAIFYFNFEDSSCESNDGNKNQSISGSDLMATSNNLDFTLLRLSVTPPAAYTPYYAGWDRSGIVPSKTVCIHHPSGDAKKISIDNDQPITATYSDAKFTFDTNTHWKILNWEVGTTEGGSSGSPLFDENHRIIGDLTGGDANCETSVNDFYAKFSASWENYPNASEQLKVWLDPAGTGVQVLDGHDPYGGLLAKFVVSEDTICYSTGVTVNDISAGNPDSFSWDFGEGAVPSTASGKGPHSVTYSTAGSKTIKLIAGKDGVLDSIKMNVLAVDMPEAAFDYSLKKQVVTMIDESVDAKSYSWNFGDGVSSTEKNPSHTYASSGKYQIGLTVTNVCGSNSTSKEIKISYNDQLKIYPNPSVGNFTIDLSKIVFDDLQWYVYSANGKQVRSGKVPEFSNQLQFSLEGLNAGVYFLKLNVDGEKLERKLLLVK
jgi:PKD repeat protein